MDLVHELKVLLIGDGTSLGASLREGAVESEALGAKTGLAQTALSKLGLQGKSTGELIGTGLQVGSAAGVVAIGGMAFEGVKHFADMTSEVRGFQRTLGGTAEDASRLAAATDRMGIDAQTAQTAFGQLTKRIGEGKDTLGQWGVEIARNHDGSVNMAATLANISEKYASIQDPAQRAAFASENFGKGYQSINALLGQGKTNLEDFYKIAAEHHQIFNQDDLNKGLELNRSLKDLNTAFQGIEVELGKAVVPAVTTLAHELEFGVEMLDKMGGSLSSGTVLAGGFALAGAKLGGPWGAAAGATLGFVAQGMDDFANRTLHATDVVSQFGPALATMDAAKAAASWDQAVRKMQDAGGIIEGTGNKLKLFRDLADSDPIGAQKIVTGMQQRGESTSGYEKILTGAVKRQAEAKAATDAASTANAGLVASTDKSTGALKEETAATKEQLDALKALTDTVDAAANADLGLITARDSATQAVDAYTKAEQDAAAAGGQSTEKNAALHDQLLKTEGSLLSTAEASRKAAEADETQSQKIAGVSDAQAIATAGNAAYRGELAGLAAGLAPDSPLRIFLQGVIDNFDAIARPHAGSVTIDTSQAHVDLDDLERRLNDISSHPWEMTIGVAAAFTGGAGNLQAGP